jgi:hypothetical protein
MGFFKLFTNLQNENGIREAMKLSYKRVAKTLDENIPVKLFQNAMYNALGTRYLVNGININEPQLWMELRPFISIDNQKDALDLLCEYVIYKELPSKCDCDKLKRLLNNAIEEMDKEMGLLEFVWNDWVECNT